MAVTRAQEIWALALWVERTHGVGWAALVAERIAHFEAEGASPAVELWKQVARRFEELRPT